METSIAETAMSSSEARDAIFSRHEMLRRLVAETVKFAGESPRPEPELDTLRGYAWRLYELLDEHMSFEERMLPTALRDVIGWGAILQAEMHEDQERQRAELISAELALIPDGLTATRLVEDLRAFTRRFLADMEKEEDGLLHADIDCMVADSRGG
jgi:hypothetical protein